MRISVFIRIISILFFVFITGHAGAVTLKIATLSPDGSAWMKKMRTGAKEVDQKTNGRVRLKYYPGGVMGNDKAVIRKIRIRQLHGGAIVIGSLSQFFPDIQIYNLPMKYRSLEEIDYVRLYVDPIVVKGLEKAGFVTLGMAGGGLGYVMSNEPIRSVQEMREKKVWVPDNDATILEAAKAFGLTPIPLSIADVRTGLQTGMIDTVTTSPIGAVALQWHTQVDYLMELPFLYVFGILVVDKRTFSKISPTDQSTVREITGRVFNEIDRQNRKDNLEALNALRKQGIRFLKPPPDALQEWYLAASKVPTRLIKAGRLSQGIVDIIEKRIFEYRAKQADADE